MSDEVKHYGTPRHSGRYPWGSGENPYQRDNMNFLAMRDKLKAKGLTEVEIAKEFGITTTELRKKVTLVNAEILKSKYSQAYRLQQKGYGDSEIARIMGLPGPSSVRSILKSSGKSRQNKIDSTVDILKKSVKEKGYIDVGSGSELHMGITPTTMKAALQKLKEEGYAVETIYEQQVFTGNKTRILCLAAPGTTKRDIYLNKDKISLSTGYYSEDNGETFLGIKPPKSIESSRISINYAEDGGKDADGVIYLRRGVDDLDLGNSRYAQVRIAVDGTHYLKGMAMYKDDLPDGVDIVFNTNKHSDVPKMEVLKSLKDDPDNPFGATISRQNDSCVLNIVNEEGSWSTWSKTIASQMLSKQPVKLAQKQLDIAYKERQDEFDEIMSLTNPVVKEKLLMEFASNCDSASVHLKAAAFPGQASHVILPFSSIKDDQIYAPNYSNGEEVVLIRYPHGGKFEIPRLIVNNNNKEAKSSIGQAKDAVGINAKVAEQLSGADFDGDTVLVIPTSKGSGKMIKSSKSLDGLKDFDPKEAYPGYEGMTRMTDKQKQPEMGKISNLITDMTIKGATEDEIARAVRHSMVVIDAPKHGLNYKQSYIDNGIAELKKEYQGGTNSGASTLISKAKSQVRVPERKEAYKPNAKTGEKEYYDTGATYQQIRTSKGNKKVDLDTYSKINKDLRSGKSMSYVENKYGVKIKEKQKLTKTTAMEETKDAYSLSSGTQIEGVYASYANKLKSLSNTARKEALIQPKIEVNSSAKKTYEKEVASLDFKLNTAKKNQPLERKAQSYANTVVSAKKRDNPELYDDADQLKKVKAQALKAGRTRFGAHKQNIYIEDSEWKAIQSGAISTSKLKSILNNADMDRVKQLATPRASNTISATKEAKIKTLLSQGYTQSEVSEAVGVSITTINKIT